MMDAASDTDTYAGKAAEFVEIPAPELPYKPPMPKVYRPKIGLIGTGGISASHLDAYRTAGWEVAALWNRTQAKAKVKAAEYCPAARIVGDWRDILTNPQIDVVDITLHPEHRAPIIEAALKAGKHVLSQKPFVSDLKVGAKLVALAEANNVFLAVNQNGRWSPHFSWMRAALKAGLIGNVISVHSAVHWDHSWTAGTPFDEVEDLILYDFGIHWFDALTSFIGARDCSVYATATYASEQLNKVPLLAQALVQFDGGHASLVFDGAVKTGARDTTVICGTNGMLTSTGSDLSTQKVTLTTLDGVAQPKLEGQWFNDGFQGAMGALLVAIETRKEPENSAKDNLHSLKLTFAARQSKESQKAINIKV
jgi:predicted dehydrogenase